MNIYFKLFFLLLMSCKLTAQKSEWKEIGSTFDLKIIKEDSKENLKTTDSLQVEIYRFQEDEKIDLSDLTKLQMIPLKTSLNNLKTKLKTDNFNPAFKKNSEYLIKYKNKKGKDYQYSLYLSDNSTKEQTENLIGYLNMNFKIDKIDFISKKEAAKRAQKTMGIDNEELFEGDIFPASIEIESKVKLNLKNLVKKYSQLITDISDNESYFGTIIMKITT